MNYKSFIFTALLGFATASVSAQFHEVIGGTTNGEKARDLINTADGGHLFVGVAEGINAGDVLVVKTNATGTVSWQKTYGNASTLENASCVIEVSDGYVIGGTTANGGTVQAYIFKINLTGTTVNWTKKLSATSAVHEVCLSHDGHPVFAGAYGNEALALKLDKATGATLFNKTYNFSTGNEIGYGITRTSDNGFGICGQLDHLGTTKLLVMKINSAGTFSSASFHSCLSYQSGQSITEATDGGLVVTGLATDLVSDFKQYIVKTNSTTGYLWSKLYGFAGRNYSGSGIVRTSDGGYITSSEGGVLLKLNATGNVTWSNRLHGILMEVAQTAAGDYVITGSSSTLVGPIPDLYMVKTTSTGDCCADLPNLFTTYTHTASASGVVLSSGTAPAVSAGTIVIGTPTFPTTSNCTLCSVSAGPDVNNTATDACCVPANSCSSVLIGLLPLSTYTYSWSPTTALGSPTNSQTTASPCGTTTYALEASAPGCLVNVDLVQVTTTWTICCPHMAEPGNGVSGASIYPNPSTGMFTIALQDVTDFDQQLEIKVTDMVGRQVYYEKGTAATVRHEVDLSSESKGIYLITVTIGELVTTEKLELE